MLKTALAIAGLTIFGFTIVAVFFVWAIERGENGKLDKDIRDNWPDE
jgi:hypothetical protein